MSRAGTSTVGPGYGRDWLDEAITGWRDAAAVAAGANRERLERLAAQLEEIRDRDFTPDGYRMVWTGYVMDARRGVRLAEAAAKRISLKGAVL